MDLCQLRAQGVPPPTQQGLSACISDIEAQLERRRKQRILYRRWVKSYLMSFEVYDGVSTEDAARLVCDKSMPDNPTLSLQECLEIAVNEVEIMRYGDAWKTKRPSLPPAGTETYWDAILSMEAEIEERGHIVYDGHTAHCPQKIKFFFQIMKNSPDVTQVCEIGFNAGHSALAFLHGLSNANVLSFDLGVHEYVTVARDILQERYPGRLELVLGDSAETVPRYFAQNPHKRCNIIFIDGSHLYEPVYVDMMNMLPVANQKDGHILIMDDFGCTEPYCRNVRTAWYRMVHEHRVQERFFITTEEYTHIVGGGETPVVNGMVAGLFWSETTTATLRQDGNLRFFG